MSASGAYRRQMVSRPRLVRAAGAAALLAGCVAATLAGGPAGTAAAASGPTAVVAAAHVTPDVPNLSLGARPRLPYVDWNARRIVDGDRRISISGIQGRVISLHKVDGGYLLGRRLSVGHDVVLVGTRGARRVLVGSWVAPRTDQLYPGLAVSRNGERVVVNAATTTGTRTSYAETRVLTLPAGRLVRAHAFPSAPLLLGYGVDRAMLSVEANTVWWTPGTDEVDTLRAAASGQSADLTAWQWAVRPQVGVYSVQGIPPRTSPDWPIDQEDVILGPWSLDDRMVAGTNEVTDQGSGIVGATNYLVHRASDGESVFRVTGEFVPQITWESDTALLLRTYVEEDGNHQLIRCTLGGSCQRVGPPSASQDGVIIPATRRNS